MKRFNDNFWNFENIVVKKPLPNGSGTSEKIKTCVLLTQDLQSRYFLMEQLEWLRIKVRSDLDNIDSDLSKIWDAEFSGSDTFYADAVRSIKDRQISVSEYIKSDYTGTLEGNLIADQSFGECVIHKGQLYNIDPSDDDIYEFYHPINQTMANVYIDTVHKYGHHSDQSNQVLTLMVNATYEANSLLKGIRFYCCMDETMTYEIYALASSLLNIAFDRLPYQFQAMTVKPEWKQRINDLLAPGVLGDVDGYLSLFGNEKFLQGIE
jgi:hypothetical protein